MRHIGCEWLLLWLCGLHLPHHPAVSTRGHEHDVLSLDGFFINDLVAIEHLDPPRLAAFERVVFEYLTRARYCTELQIVNGLKRGLVTRAIEGEDVGTIIYKD